MDALINITNNASSNLQKELISLLKQKIEDSIIDDKPVIICISNSEIECRNTINIADYEVSDNYFSLNASDADIELHIKLNEADVKYDNILEDEFIFIYEYMEIRLYFIG